MTSEILITIINEKIPKNHHFNEIWNWLVKIIIIYTYIYLFYILYLQILDNLKIKKLFFLFFYETIKITKVIRITILQ